MNERIKELMGKTLDDKFSHTWDTMTHEGLLQFSEKFAELIVRECAQHAVEFNNNNQSLPDKVMRGNLYRVSDYIKDRMGVEE